MTSLPATASDADASPLLVPLAHELRNLLAPISYGLHVMGLAAGDPETIERVREMMERQLRQMGRLIDDLLDVSRISRGQIDLRRERVDLGAVVLDALDASRPLVQACGHELTVSMPPEPVLVDVDVARLSQAVSNLLNNAAKYTPRGGHIRLVVEQEGGSAIVSVADDGIGIPSPMLPRVFDLFTQGEPSRESAVQGGLGIGLAIVKRLVEMHGGTVEARSGGPGAGSQFLVRLASAAAAALQTARGDGAGAGASERRILVVDDDPDSVLALSMMLRMMGHDTRTAADGRQALEAARALRPHLVLLDIGRPELDGYDTCRRLREQSWADGVVIVAMTGWGQAEDRRRSRDAGFDHHLVKPVDRAVLARLLDSLR